MKLIKLINKTKFLKIRKQLANIENIHSGGCGISALALLEWLKKRNETCTPYFLYEKHNIDDYNNNKSRLKRNEKELIAPCHVCLLYKKTFIDSKKKDVNKGFAKTHPVTKEILLATINNTRSWNPAFNRTKELKNIEKIIGFKLNIKTT